MGDLIRHRGKLLTFEQWQRIIEDILWGDTFLSDLRKKGVRAIDSRITKSMDPPENPDPEQFWLDTSVEPNILKMWNGGDWVKVTPTTAAEIAETLTRKWAGESGADVTGDHSGDIDFDLVPDADVHAKLKKTDISDGHLFISQYTAYENDNYDPTKKRRVFRQASAPTTGMETGDVWIDTDNGDKPYTYDGSGWVQAYTAIDGGHITSGVITGRTLQTAASGQRFVVSAADNQAHFYDSGGNLLWKAGENVFESLEGTWYKDTATQVFDSGNRLMGINADYESDFLGLYAADYFNIGFNAIRAAGSWIIPDANRYPALLQVVMNSSGTHFKWHVSDVAGSINQYDARMWLDKDGLKIDNSLSVGGIGIDIAGGTYTGKDVAGVSYIATTGSSQVTIQGLSNGRQGQIIFFLNSAGVDVAFQHENGNASTGDQIRTPNGVTWWLGVDANAEYDACILQYHGDYWFIFGATDLGYNT